MSSALLPREYLAAARRWELDSFDPAARRAASQAPAPAAQLPTAAQLEQIHQQAQAEGYAAGLEEGRATIARTASQLDALIQGMECALQSLDQSVTEELLALAAEVARRVVGDALQLKPELVVSVVREALRELSQTRQERVLALHPLDATLVREHLGARLAPPAWQIIEDAQLARGGCRIESAGGEVDATLATRWRRVLAALGRDDAWVE